MKKVALIGKVAARGALLVLASWSFLAGQEPVLRSTGQEMAGSWLLEVRPATAPPFPLLITFHSDGTASAVAPDANTSAQVGAWVRTDDRRFLLTLVFFTFDPTTKIVNTISKGRSDILLGDTLDTFYSTTERVALDLSGAQISATSGIPATGRRIAVERQATPVAPVAPAAATPR